MEDKYHLLMSQLGEDRLKRNININEYLQTGLETQVGGVYIATSARELIKAVQLCQELEIPFKVIGTGSKIDLPKDGFGGVIIKNRYDELKIFGVKGKVSRSGIGVEEAYLEAGSGASLDRLSEFAGEQRLTGFEDLKGVSGTVGGSLPINIVLNKYFCQVEIINSSGGQETLDKIPGVTDIIVSVTFNLKAARSPA